MLNFQIDYFHRKIDCNFYFFFKVSCLLCGWVSMLMELCLGQVQYKTKIIPCGVHS